MCNLMSCVHMGLIYFNLDRGITILLNDFVSTKKHNMSKRLAKPKQYIFNISLKEVIIVYISDGNFRNFRWYISKTLRT